VAIAVLGSVAVVDLLPLSLYQDKALLTWLLQPMMECAGQRERMHSFLCLTATGAAVGLLAVDNRHGVATIAAVHAR
jgi:hypothetical protein